MTRRHLAPLLLLALTAAAPPEKAAKGPTEAQRYDGCIRAIPTNAHEAELFAMQWRARGGGLPARHCQALAQLQQRRFAEAAANLAMAAQAAEAEKSPFAADFWGQAGNAALLGGDNATARTYLTTAITAVGSGPRAAPFRVDRARAQVELGDLAAARQDLDAALAADREDPEGWLLSAALARRQGDIGRAAREIERASTLAPSDPDIMFEQGNIAAANGDIATARLVWARVEKAAPGSSAADLAAKALAAAGPDPAPPAKK